MTEAIPFEGDQLLHEPPTNRLMLERLEDARRSRSTNIEQRKTSDRFRKATPKEQKLDNAPLKGEEKVELIYGEAQEFIRNFDTTIVKCKRFNEVKTYRKYEVIMRDMELEIMKLRDKLQMEEQMRSPTKEYLSDILNKLVEYKNDNERLKKELSDRDKTIACQHFELQNLKGGMQKLENTLKGRIERLPPIPAAKNHVGGVQQPVKIFLDAKAESNHYYSLKTSKLEDFLRGSWQHLWEWDVTRLLSQLDKFIEKVPEHLQVDMWKIRLGAAKRLSSVVDASPNKSMSSLTNLTVTEVDTQRSSDAKERMPHWSLLKRSRRR